MIESDYWENLEKKVVAFFWKIYSSAIPLIVTWGKEMLIVGMQGAERYIFAVRISNEEGTRRRGSTHFLNLRIPRILFKSSASRLIPCHRLVAPFPAFRRSYLDFPCDSRFCSIPRISVKPWDWRKYVFTYALTINSVATLLINKLDTSTVINKWRISCWKEPLFSNPHVYVEN